MENTGMKVLIHASAFFAPYLVPILLFLISDEDEIKKLSIQAVLFQIVIGVLITISAIMIRTSNRNSIFDWFYHYVVRCPDYRHC